MGHLSRPALIAMLLSSSVTMLVAQGPVAVPRPFPGAPGAASPAAPPPSAAAPEAAPPTPQPPAAAPHDVPVYPAAEFIAEYDAGRGGQRYFLYGTNAPFSEIVTYYRNVLRNGGRELYKQPAMQQFDLGRYQEESMAYPPSVVVKDYGTGDPAGYLAVSGTSQKRFRTVIQIVPPPAPQSR